MWWGSALFSAISDATAGRRNKRVTVEAVSQEIEESCGRRMRPTPPDYIEPTREDEELSRRFIAAFIHPEEGLLKALYSEGMSVEAVNARAAQMGLTTELIKNSRLTGVLPAMRTCIGCDARFLSAGPHNRMCKRCLSR